MKTFFSLLVFSAFIVSPGFASVGESQTECVQMQEANERSNPKANLEQTIQSKKPTSSSAVKG